jgi:hypothetical protein
MRLKTTLILAILSTLTFAQNSKNISGLLGGTSIIENNKVYGKVKTIENYSFVDTAFVMQLMHLKTNDLHFANYFLAFDSAQNVVEKKIDADTIYYHKKYIYNNNTLIENDLVNNTQIKWIYNNGKRSELLSKEWIDTTNTPRRQNYSYKYFYNKNKKVDYYIRIISENNSVVAENKFVLAFDFDNISIVRKFCSFKQGIKYEKSKKREILSYKNSKNTISEIFFYKNKLGKLEKYEEFSDSKKQTEYFYEYDYNLLQKIIKYHYASNAKSIYYYDSREFLVKKESFDAVKDKKPTKTYIFNYEFDKYGNWVKIFDGNTNNLLVERQITYYE